MHPWDAFPDNSAERRYDLTALPEEMRGMPQSGISGISCASGETSNETSCLFADWKEFSASGRRIPHIPDISAISVKNRGSPTTRFGSLPGSEVGGDSAGNSWHFLTFLEIPRLSDSQAGTAWLSGWEMSSLRTFPHIPAKPPMNRLRNSRKCQECKELHANSMQFRYILQKDATF